MTTSRPRRIVIIGAGVAGLSLALALKSSDFEVFIFEEKCSFSAMPHLVLWKQGLRALEKLGLLDRIEMIGEPLGRLVSRDSDTGQVLVNWDSGTGNDGLTGQRTKSHLDGPFGEEHHDLEAGTCKKDKHIDTGTRKDTLPPMIAIRQVDLIKTLLGALASGNSGAVDVNGATDAMDHLKIVNEDLESLEIQDNSSPQYVEASGDSERHKKVNGDSEITESQDITSSLYVETNDDENYDTPETTENQIPDSTQYAENDDWYTNEGFADSLPNIYMGCELVGIIVSSTYGTVTCTFSDGQQVECDMLIGADGYYSKVRDDITTGRCPPQHAGSFVINGVSDVSSIPAGSHPKESFESICPKGAVTSYIGETCNFGISYMGNGKYGWNLIAEQPNPSFVLEKFLLFRELKFDSRETIDAGTNQRESLTYLSKPEIISLAIELVSNNSLSSHSQIVPLILASEPSNLFTRDNVDLNDSPPSSFTSPKFHPGRVILIGDAAHTIATAPHGSVGASLALCDSVVLAELICDSFSPSTYLKIAGASIKEEKDAAVLKFIAVRFDDLRMGDCTIHMNEAHNISKWKKQGGGIWNTLRNSFKNLVGVCSWEGLSFSQMQDLGQVSVGLPEIATLPNLQ